METAKQYRCSSCGMDFYDISAALTGSENKNVICSYCESELWHPLLIK